MSLQWPARSASPAWSNPVAWWWSLLPLVSGVNIAVWCWLYGSLQSPASTGSNLWSMLGAPLRANAGTAERLGGDIAEATARLHTPGIELMLLLSAAYVFGCAFRSFLPRADVNGSACSTPGCRASRSDGPSPRWPRFALRRNGRWSFTSWGTMTGAGTALSAAWAIVH